MKLKSISLCALLMTSMLLVALPEPATSYEEFPDNPPQPFSDPPNIGSYGVNPDTGWNDTTFSFYLNATLDYFWNDTIPRLNETVQVWVDNEHYDMFENNTKDTNWSDGKHWYWMNEERLWSKGSIPYLFYVEVNESSNTTGTSYFEIYNRVPYILSPPPMLIYVDEIVTYTIRVQDDDLDPIDGDLIDHNFTGGDWWFIYWYEDNLTFYGKPKKEFVRWLNITIWDSYGQIAWYRWTIECIENTGGSSTPPSPKSPPQIPRFIDGIDILHGTRDRNWR